MMGISRGLFRGESIRLDDRPSGNVVNSRFRRILLVAAGSREGRLTELRAAAQPCPRELAFITFGDLCFIRSSCRREAAEYRIPARNRGAPNNHTVEREWRLPRRQESKVGMHIDHVGQS
jgi:hypothetical protein